MSRRNLLAVAVIGVVFSFVPATARADDVEHAPAPNYFRAALEEIAILGGGAVQYASTSSNSQDWDLGYDWPSYRSKLSGASVRFDTNRYDTNMVTHPVAGTLYYIAARSNRLSVLESLFFAAGSSTFWEYIGEFREFVSVNDLIVTPLSGLAFGEAFTRLGLFFDRSRPNALYQSLGVLFGPGTRAHALIDGTRVAPDARQDSLGLTREVGHRFELRLGMGAGNNRTTSRFELHTEILEIPHYGEVGAHREFLNDTSFSTIDVEGAVGGSGLRDMLVDVQVAPFAFVVKDLKRPNGRLEGDRLLVGITTGFHYEWHVYPTTPGGDADRIAGVHVGGVLAEYKRFGSKVNVRTSLGLRPEFVAPQSFALRSYYLKGGDPNALPTVSREQGYYYAGGVEVTPSIELEMGRWTLGAEARFAFYSGFEGLDRKQELVRNEIAFRDRRSLARASISFAPTDALRLRLGVERRTRLGQVGNVSASDSEWAVVPTMGVLF